MHCSISFSMVHAEVIICYIINYSNVAENSLGTVPTALNNPCWCTGYSNNEAHLTLLSTSLIKLLLRTPGFLYTRQPAHPWLSIEAMDVQVVWCTASHF